VSTETCSLDETAISLPRHNSLKPIELDKSTGAPWQVPHAQLEQCRILIVDDEDLNIRVVRKYLRSWGFSNVCASSEPTEIIEMIHRERPDLVLLDVMMPGISGMDLLKTIRETPAMVHLPVIILTAHFEEEVKYQALKLGANDFLSKPIDAFELLPRVRNLLALRVHQNWLERESERLEHEVQRRTASLVAAERHLVQCLARAAEFRDNDTGRHVIRVGKYAALIARALNLGENYAQTIEQAAKLHDVGKIGIPDRILLKAGKLDPDEFEAMKAHCNLGSHVLLNGEDEARAFFRSHVNMGAAILSDLDSPLLRMAGSIVSTHHERWDGTGYPRGLKGEQIPLEGRITAVADVFDALSMRRPYKPAFPIEKCFAILSKDRGTHFDPTVVDAFLSRSSDAIAIQFQHSDCEVDA
jgi:putative two-component system response regulator